MTNIHRIATLNINGMSSPTRLAMLGDFLHKHEIDIIFLQEVTQPTLHTPWGYAAHTNVGTNGRGTAIVTREHYALNNIVRLPSGRGMAAEFQGLWLVNVYAPSGAERKQEREVFFNMDLPQLLLETPSMMLIGGDFNCVLSKTDCTGNFNYSRALHALIRGLDLIDMWETAPERRIFTHYTRQGVTRLDRIYATSNLRGKKCGIETVLAAFTDHLAVILRITLDANTIRRGTGYWKMNIALAQNMALQEKLRQQWIRWKQQRKYFPNIVMWWERVVKKQIRLFFIREGTEARRDAREMENFYQACLYDLLQMPEQHENRMAKINQLKAKLVNLFNTPSEKHTFHPRVINNTNITFSDTEMALLQKGPKYNLHSKKKNWLRNLALEAETAVTQLPITDRKFYRKLIADRTDTLQNLNTPHLNTRKHPESHTMNSIQTKLKGNQAMVTTADKGNSLVILPIQQYEIKIQKFLLENNFQTTNTDPTKTFQTKIRRTINASKTMIPRDIKWKYINLNPSPPTIKGLIKIHKPTQPIRPVVNLRNAPPYKLAKLFTQKINQLTPLPYSFNVKNTKKLILNLKDTPIQPHFTLASLHITNMYSNIRVTETREILTNIMKNNLLGPRWRKKWPSKWKML
jgi:exonuclease III